MAVTWDAKAPAAEWRYSWFPALAEGDSIKTHSLTVASGDVTIGITDIDEKAVVAFVIGGTAGTVSVIDAQVTTNDGETLVDTIYLPIAPSALALSYTARDICEFALRKVVGIGETPTSGELADALERLNDMLASWATQGADIGVPLPVADNTVFRCADAFISAVKNSLIIELSELYGLQAPASAVMNARRGLQQVKMSLLSTDDRATVYY